MISFIFTFRDTKEIMELYNILKADSVNTTEVDVCKINDGLSKVSNDMIMVLMMHHLKKTKNIDLNKELFSKGKIIYSKIYDAKLHGNKTNRSRNTKIDDYEIEFDALDSQLQRIIATYVMNHEKYM